MLQKWVRNLVRKTPLAWLQVKREKMRLAVALAGIAFADVLMLVQLGFSDALYDSAAGPYTVLQGDLFLVNPVFESLSVFKSFPRERLYQAAGINDVTSITSLYIDRGQWRNPHTRLEKTILVFGVDPVNSAIALSQVTQHQNELKLLNRVLYDRAGREDFFGITADSFQRSSAIPIQVNGSTIQVIGSFTLGASFSADGNMITSDSTFLRLFPKRQPNQIDVGVLKLAPGADVNQTQTALQANLPNDVVVLTHEELVAREKDYWANASPIGFIFGFGTVIGFVVGTVIVYQILYSDVSDHLPEYATLKAMGYNDAYLIGVLIQESLILAVLGFVPGLVLSTGLCYIAASATFLPIKMTLSRAVTVLILTIIMCSASGAIAMRKLQSADPADIF
ncbi:MAG: FtsX-like permease family protein [Leptolyngbyaceae cyanobacterium RU_5_1]|nr:FtsX-like permease family protein [Leptolyngbyaceae cyanobacterium RU_5_1]